MNKSHAFHSTTRRRGAILVLALAVVALAGSSVLHSHLVARARMKADREALRASILDAAMEDAARNAILLLAEDSDLLVDHLAKPWAKPHEITTPAGVDLFVAIEDLNRYFDLNNLCTHADEISTRPAEDMLADLLLGLGDYESTEHAATLRDWMDSGEDGPRERHWYDEQGLNIRPPNRPLTGFSEWIGIPGFTREFVERKSDRPGATAIQDHLTIIPFARNRPIPINVNTATPDVLRCVL